MAIHIAVVQTVAGWFTTEKRVQKNFDLATTQRSGASEQAIMKASPDEEDELHRVRKARTDLMKFQTINRPY